MQHLAVVSLIGWQLLLASLCLVALGSCQPWAVGTGGTVELSSMDQGQYVLSLVIPETAPEQTSVLESLQQGKDQGSIATVLLFDLC